MKSLLICAALLAPLGAASAAADDPNASTWGAPLPASAPTSAAPASEAAATPASAPEPAASAASAGAPARPPTAYASARAGTAATGDYFHDFAELIVRVRSVKWIEEICSEAFPTTAELNAHAYGDWIHDHGPFVDEMEGQFDLIDRYWGDMSPDLRKSGISTDALRRLVAAQRDALRQDFHATSPTVFQRRCDAYPEILLSPQLDLEKSQSDYVRSVRLGPR